MLTSDVSYYQEYLVKESEDYPVVNPDGEAASTFSA